MEVNIHNSEHNLERRIEMIKGSKEICQENKEDIIRSSEYGRPQRQWLSARNLSLLGCQWNRLG